MSSEVHGAVPSEAALFSVPQTEIWTPELTEKDREAGYKTLGIYETKIKRIHPWITNAADRTITLINTKRVLPQNPDDFATRSIEVGSTIDLRVLEREKISPETAQTIAIFKFVEDYLVDYSAENNATARNYYGISLSNYQWIGEEAEHGRADGLILTGTGNSTEQELYDMYVMQRSTTYEMPYKSSIRKALMFGKLQEWTAGLNYNITAKKAEEDGSPTAAKVLRLVGKDEIYHSRGYDLLLEPLIEIDPEAARKEAIEIAVNFAMPAEDLMVDILGKRDAIGALRATRAVGTLSGESLRDVIEVQLGTLSCVSKEDAHYAADSWMDKQHRAKT